MKKKLLAAVLSGTMLLSLIPAGAETSFRFSDDSKSGTWTWASDYIYAAYEKNIFKGDDNGNFNPDNKLTRAEAVTAILALKGVKPDKYVTSSGFTDADGSWYTPYVAAAKDCGLSSGYSDGTFKPTANITRAEFVTMLLAAMDIQVDTNNEDSGFTDANGQWYSGYVAAAKDNGLSSGYSDGTFKPTANISRAEAATMTANVEVDSSDEPSDEPSASPSAPPSGESSDEPSAQPSGNPSADQSDPSEVPAVDRREDTTDPDEYYVGAHVYFGTYEQDNDTSNGAESIEWRVLAVEDGYALLLSEYCLDCQPYSDGFTDVTWSTSSLRAWLNSDFLDAAFTTEEQGILRNSSLENPDSYGGYDAEGNAIISNTEAAVADIYWSSDGGSITSDRVFLPTIDEVTEYLDYTPEELTDTDGYSYYIYPDLQASPTAYAVSRGASCYEVDGIASWWLRSTDGNGYSGAYVDGYGDTAAYGADNELAVRPAIWVNLSFKSADAADTTDPDEYYVGNHIYFGSYEQDNDLTNGAEPIEWRILDVQDGKALLLSEYCLDKQPYSVLKDGIMLENWEGCTLRTWLNDDFLNAAFTLNEQKTIQTTAVENRSVYEGNDAEGNLRITNIASELEEITFDMNDSITPSGTTYDKLFLLDLSEAREYLDGDVTETEYYENGNSSEYYVNMLASPTEYAKAQGVNYWDTHGREVSWWWLRSDTCLYRIIAPGVDYNGNIRFMDANTYRSDAVRPAMWVEIP